MSAMSEVHAIIEALLSGEGVSTEERQLVRDYLEGSPTISHEQAQAALGQVFAELDGAEITGI